MIYYQVIQVVLASISQAVKSQGNNQHLYNSMIYYRVIQTVGVTASSGTVACQAANCPGNHHHLYNSMFYYRVIQPAGVTAFCGTAACQAVKCPGSPQDSPVTSMMLMLTSFVDGL